MAQRRARMEKTEPMSRSRDGKHGMKFPQSAVTFTEGLCEANPGEKPPQSPTVGKREAEEDTVSQRAPLLDKRVMEEHSVE